MEASERPDRLPGPADTYEKVLVPALFGRWPDKVLDSVDVRSGHDVLDVGCGTGVLATAARPRVGPDGSVVGIDPNAAMLSVAARSNDRVHWVAGGAPSSSRSMTPRSTAS